MMRAMVPSSRRQFLGSLAAIGAAAAVAPIAVRFQGALAASNCSMSEQSWEPPAYSLNRSRSNVERAIPCAASAPAPMSAYRTPD